MNLNELATAVSNQTPVVVFIMNNGVLGMVRQWQTLFFDKHYSNTTLEWFATKIEIINRSIVFSSLQG